MAWWTRFLRAFKRESDSDEAIAFGQNAFSVPSLTGVNINQQTALSSTAVLAAVTMLAEDVAKLPWALYRGQEDGSRVAVEDHWLSELLQQPNAWQNGFEFREQMQLALVMRGNAYAAIARSSRGVPYKLIPINPDWVSLWEAPGGDLFYRVTPTGLHLMAELRDQPFLIPSADMLHIRGFSLNGLLGSSRIMLAREAVGLAIAQEQTCVRWMGQGARPSGSFTTDQKLNEATAKRLLSELKGYFGGLQNSGKMMLLEQGLKWQSHSMTAQEAEFVAARGFQLAEVARAFRVPPHLIADLSRSTNNNIVQQSQEYVNFTITGYTRRWSEKYSSTFSLRKEKLFIEFDYAVLTRADIATRYNNYRTGIMSMVLTPDEARLDDGRAPMGDDAAKLQFPANMAAAGSQSTGTAPDGAGRPKENEARGLSEEQLNRLAGKIADRLVRYDEDQPRDENGRFGSGGGGSVVFSDKLPRGGEVQRDQEISDEGGNGLYKYDVAYDKDGNATVANLQVFVEPTYEEGDDGELLRNDDDEPIIAADSPVAEADFYDAADVLDSAALKDAQDRVSEVEKGELADRAELAAEEARWNALTPAQQKAEEAAEDERREKEDDAHTQSIHDAIDKAIESGWQPEFNSLGSLHGGKIPSELKGFASPKSMDKILEHLSGLGFDVPERRAFRTRRRRRRLRRSVRYSDDQPREENGQFGSGGLSSRIATTVADVKSFIKGKSAADVIAAAASTEIAKEALSFALQSMLSHATGLDQSTWKLNEEFVESAVHHFRDGAEITVLQAREAMRTCVRGLTALRETQVAKILMRAEETPEDLALKWLKAVAAVLDNDELFKESES
jgi:HK97 family phage portal protein